MIGGGTTTFNLSGYNQSLNGLSTSVSTVGVGITNNTQGTHTGNSLLTVGGNNQTASFGGVISDGTAGTISLTKIGTGVQTLGGANTYTGDTNINNGALFCHWFAQFVGHGQSEHVGERLRRRAVWQWQCGNRRCRCCKWRPEGIINPGATGAGTFGTLTMSSLSVGAGTDLQFDLQNAATGSSDQIAPATTAFTGAATISPSGTPVAGDYTVIQSSGPITGSQLSLNTANDTRLTFAFAQPRGIRASTPTVNRS